MSIIQTFDIYLPKMEKRIKEFPWSDKEAYVHFLAQNYFIGRHVGPLICTVAKRLTAANHIKLRAQFLEDIKEEHMHYLLAEGDLKSLGYKLNGVSEYSITREIYKDQYGFVDLQGPTLLGFLLQFEALTARAMAPALEIAQKTYGNNSSHFVHHFNQQSPMRFQKTMAKFSELTDRENTRIIGNFQQCCENYMKVLEMAAGRSKAAAQAATAFKNAG